MIVRNGSSELTEVHFDGKSEKQVFVGNNLVWSTIDLDKYSFSVEAFPDSNNYDYTASNNIDGITNMAIQNSLQDFIEITPSTKIASADMKRINYVAGYERPMYIYYTGNYISEYMFDESDNSYNDIHIHSLVIYKNLDYIGGDAFRGFNDESEDFLNIRFGKNVTKIPSLSSNALPKKFLTKGLIYVPKSLEAEFKNTDVWKNYADRINGY